MFPPTATKGLISCEIIIIIITAMQAISINRQLVGKETMKSDKI